MQTNVINKRAFFTVRIARNIAAKSPIERAELLAQLDPKVKAGVLLALKNM